MNYNLTLEGHVENLTSGQGYDLIRKGLTFSHQVRKGQRPKVCIDFTDFVTKMQ